MTDFRIIGDRDFPSDQFSHQFVLPLLSYSGKRPFFERLPLGIIPQQSQAGGGQIVIGGL